MKELLDTIYNNLLEKLEEEGYLIDDHDYGWDESFDIFIEDDCQIFYLNVRIDNSEKVILNLNLASVSVEDKVYEVEWDCLPDNFEDSITFDANDTELMKKIMTFISGIKFCAISTKVREIIRELEDLQSKYTPTELRFLVSELEDSHALY